MAFRKSQEETQSQSKWRKFAASNVRLMQQIALPPAIVESQELWEDVLYYGWAEGAGPASVEDAITTKFHVDKLSESDYVCLVELAHNYFVAGFQHFKPQALRKSDQVRFDEVFTSSEYSQK